MLQQVLDMAETVAESKQTFDEASLQGKKLEQAALPPAEDDGN